MRKGSDGFAFESADSGSYLEVSFDNGNDVP